jgi:L-iditol 2-dehydrogenase
MKAARLTGPVRFEHVPDYPEPPAPGPGEAALRVRAVTICGSDLHLYKAGEIGSIACVDGVVLGHEFMGEVVAPGAGARDGFNEPLRAGQRVAVEPHVACHRCEWCERGDVNLCPHHTFIGLPGHDGALRERLVVPARNCYPVPDDMSDAAAALLEPLGVALHALDLAGSALGRRVAVIGCGGIGLLVLRLCRLAGARTLVALDPHPARLALARRWGATHALAGAAQERASDALGTTGGRGFDLVFECAWVGPALDAAVRMAAPGARLLLVGIPADDDNPFCHSTARRHGLSLLWVRRMKHTYPRAIRLASGPDPAVALDELVTHRYSLDQVAQAFATSAGYTDDVVRAVVELA